MCGNASSAALISNNIQVGNFGGTEAMSAFAGGGDVKVVALFVPVTPWQLLAKADYKGPADLKGKVSVIDFWATWCEPCIREIPNFNKLHEAYPGEEVEVIAITVESPHGEIASKVKEFGMKYPVLVGNDEVVKGFGGLIGFPTTFLVTKDWKVYKKYLGALPNKQETIKKDIEKLLAEAHKKAG